MPIIAGLGQLSAIVALWWSTVLLATALGCSDSPSEGGGAIDAGSPDGATSPDAGDSGTGGNAAVDDGLLPMLSNFRVEDAHHDRVYFDSSEPIAASTATGFDVSGKTIVGITTVSGQTTGHYFAIDGSDLTYDTTDFENDPSVYADNPFTFFDNNTIKYLGGSDIADGHGNGVVPFSLTYIQNQIVEPSTTEDRYVTAAASGSGSGSLGDPWTLEQAFANVTAGQTVWVEKGDYGDSSVTLSNKHGTPDSPIKIIGYREQPGDITDHIVDTFTYVDPAAAEAHIDASAYPVLTGTNRQATGLMLRESSYVIVKNFQVKRYQYNVHLYGNCEGIHLENIASSNAWYDYANANDGSCFFAGATRELRVRLYKCLAFDGAGQDFRINGYNNLIRQCHAYAGIQGNHDTVPYDHRATDYYISFYRSYESIALNNYMERVSDIAHGGHAVGMKSDPDGSGHCTESLIEGNEMHSISENVYFARHYSYDNVARGNRIIGHLDNHRGTALIVRDGAHHNRFEDNYIDEATSAIALWWSTEDTQSPDSANNNIFINNVAINAYRAITVTRNGTVTDKGITDNKVYNNTFYRDDPDSSEVFRTNWITSEHIHDNDLSNNIFQNYSALYEGIAAEDGWNQSANDYASCGFATPSAGVNLDDVDPQFIDGAQRDLKLRASSPLCAAGDDLDTPRYDRAGVERVPGAYSVGAYQCGD
jgi:hypothetical protein